MARRRVLVIIQGDLGDRPLGPEIRGMEIARSFATRHDVTIAASTKTPCLHQGLPVVPRSRRSLLREVRRHDVVVGPTLPPHVMSVLAPRRCVRVSDLYDPVDLEMDTLHDNARVVRQQRSLRRMQLRWSDVVISANERQQARARDDLVAADRRCAGPLLLKVPMGLPDPPEPASDHPLRRRLGISTSDPVVLWWGTPWRWLDSEGVVQAVGRLVEHRPDLRLVITAGQPRNRGSDPLNRTGAALKLASRLGLLDRNVFFFTDWVPFEERHRYLADADLGITLNTASPESRLAARTRYMDYLWASLPSVLTEGDELADEMARSGAARLVAPRDIPNVAAAIDALLDDPEAMRRAREACRAMADRYRWSAVMGELVDAVDALDAASISRAALGAVARDTAAYYADRVRDTVMDARRLLAEQRRRRAAAAGRTPYTSI